MMMFLASLPAVAMAFLSQSGGILKIFFSILLLSLLIFSFYQFNSSATEFLLFCSILMSIFFFTFHCTPFLFFFFFELASFPLFVLLLIKGVNPESVYALLYFVVYSVVASMPLLSFFYYLKESIYFYSLGFLILVPFVIKAPIYLFHYWLPYVHSESVTMASVILASLLLKLGTFGIYLFSASFQTLQTSLFFIFVVGSLLASLYCLFSADYKVIVAYSSICHMTFSVIVIEKNLPLSLICLSLVSLVHTLSGGYLFYSVDQFYLSLSSRKMALFSGNVLSLLYLAILTLVVILKFSLPPSLSFLSEFLLLSLLAPYFNFMILFSLGGYLMVLLLYNLVIFFLVNSTSGSSSGESLSKFPPLVILISLILLAPLMV